MLKEILTEYTYGNNSTTDNMWDKYFEIYIKNNLPKDKNVRIVDIGCGDGRYLSKIMKLGNKNSFGLETKPRHN